MGGISSTPSWDTLSGKPSTVSGYNITDFGTQVASSVAGVGVGGVGSYALLYQAAGGATVQGATVAGSSLRYAAAGSYNATAPAGTWRCMGKTDDGGTGGPQGITVWLRIS